MLRKKRKDIVSYVVGLSTLRSAKGSKLFSSVTAASTSREATCTLYLKKSTHIFYKQFVIYVFVRSNEFEIKLESYLADRTPSLRLDPS